MPLAKWYSANLSENVVDGMTRAAGECQALDVKVYGYDISTGYYQINDVTAPIVENVFYRYVKGETVRGITSSLNAEGLQQVRSYYGW